MVPRRVADGLRREGFQATMAVDIGMRNRDDNEHIARAASLGDVILTLDREFASRGWTAEVCAGIVCWTGSSKAIGSIIRHLTRLARDKTADEMIDMVEYAN